ncbi:hypothetical protein [Halopseudomonas pelagia]|uniref:hypothetical protein n=1 Tax=Halopseudomonas pelagia TaxID=553151 RepID=UPI0003A06B68|nr:hypothetical protein [Halopseudomonas pelagia]
MDALLIVSGVVVVLIAWAWLVLNARALGVGPLLLAIFLPLVTLVLRRRGYALIPRLLLLLGLAFILLGAALLHRDQPERFDALMAGDWIPSRSAQGDIEGELMGQRFLPDRVFWNNNELVLVEGEGERVRRSLTIRFASVPGALRQRRVERLPGDLGPGPELVMQWYTGALKAPGLRRVVDGYTMSLEFNPQPDGRTRVNMHLHLPSQDATRLAGEVWLEETPAWLKTLERESARSQPAAPANRAVVQPSVRLPVEPQLGQWQRISLLALLDEPELFLGQNVRLVTVTDRVYEGRLKAVSGDQRVVIAQPRGPNQVDYHFHPLDILSLEVRYRSTR